MEVTDDSSELTAKLEQTALHKVACYGIFGVIELTTGPYLVVIESAKILGQILECDIMKVTQLMYIPVNNAVHPITM
jgi:hypothetical protein